MDTVEACGEWFYWGHGGTMLAGYDGGDAEFARLALAFALPLLVDTRLRIPHLALTGEHNAINHSSM